MISYFQQHFLLFLLAIAILSLLIGSFLNVVIYRLPLMLYGQWRQQCMELLNHCKDNVEADAPAAKPFNLFLPRSHCPHCQQVITAWQNIPIISYIMLHGRCSCCKMTISPQYPLVELISVVLSMLVAWRFGISIQTLAGLVLTWSLISLSIIDIKEQLLPDNITLSLLWLGLLLSLFNIFITPTAAILGALAGYLSLWCVNFIYKLIRKQEGMGHGDFKLFAAFGAWFGWQLLPAIILFAALLGTVVGVSLILINDHDRQVPIPFGPYLALSGWLAMLFGNNFLNGYLYMMH